MTIQTLRAAAEQVAAKQVSSRELLAEAWRAADHWDPVIGSYVTQFRETAMAAAKRADDATARGGMLGPLHGVPVAVKDLLATTDGPTTAQSLVLDPEWGDGEESVVVSRLWQAGAIILGKTTTMEFATGSPDPSKPFPIPRNPWDPATYAGGSSSGSASGVAAGMFLGAAGTDTAASIRWPSAFCGVSGIKPTFGLVPKSRLVPLGFSLDTVGPICRTADDCALLLQVMAGHDRADPDSVPGADFVAADPRGHTDLSGMRIGVVTMLDVAAEHRDPAVTAAFERAVGVLGRLGATTTPVALPHYQETATATMVTLISEGGVYHAQNLRNRWDAYGRGTKGVLGLAPFLSGVDYVQAQRVRRLAQLSLRELFASVDVVVMPTAGIAAVPVEQADDVALGPKWPAMYTPYWNAVGNPAMSVPMGFNADGLPLGLQVVAAPFRDADALRTAAAFQTVTDWHDHRPPPLDADEQAGEDR